MYHHCEGSKEELVRDVSRFYSSSHDPSLAPETVNLPQFYQVRRLMVVNSDSVPHKIYR